jgi:hypothetical protein
VDADASSNFRTELSSEAQRARRAFRAQIVTDDLQQEYAIIANAAIVRHETALANRYCKDQRRESRIRRQRLNS